MIIRMIIFMAMIVNDDDDHFNGDAHSPVLPVVFSLSLFTGQPRLIAAGVSSRYILIILILII